VLGADVRGVDQVVLQTATIKHLAAGTAHHRIGRLGRQLFPTFPHRVFPRGPVARLAPSLKIGLGAPSQKNRPGFLKGRARFVKRGSRTARLLAKMATRSQLVPSSERFKQGDGRAQDGHGERSALAAGHQPLSWPRSQR